MNKKFSASMMCSKISEMHSNIEILNNYMDYFHIDMIDNHFVKNLGFSYDLIKEIRKIAKLPFDFHLMVTDPLDVILKDSLILPGDIVSIHLDSIFNILETIKIVKSLGAKIFLAMNPTVPISFLELIIEYIDGVNFLTVNPGYASQISLDIAKIQAEKIGKLIQKINKHNFIFEVDGNMTFENISLYSQYGANQFVLGTSSIFPNNNLDTEKLKKLTEIL